jgi:PIF1-like helicase
LKRRNEDKWINNYNPTLLRLWKGNMDIQPCGSNEAIAYYVAKYMSKAEPTLLDAGIAQAIRQIRQEETDLSRKLFKICMRIMHERQISASECVFRLCHLQMRNSTRKCVFLNTRKPKQRYRVLKFDDNDKAVGFCGNIFDRYVNRPPYHSDFDFENMSLVEFAMQFDAYYRKQGDDGVNDEDVNEGAIETTTRVPQRRITLQNNMQIVIRKVPACIRVPYFLESNDPESFYYSLLLQYLPHRNESELIGEYDSAAEAFIAHEDRIKESSERMLLFRERDRQLENALIQVHALDLFDHNPVPLAQEEEIEAEEQEENSWGDEEFRVQACAMNITQKEIFEKFTKSILDQKGGSYERIKHFVTGNAGTGKTFLFKIMRHQTNRLWRPDDGSSVIRVCALTGVAARLISGTTIHSLLKLPVQKDGRIVQMPMLTGHFLKTMRRQWKEVKFMFIDEISMVPYEMLCMVDSRLRQLKCSEEPFGGLNIILFGDLMQLPPVRGHQVFDQPIHFHPAIHLWRLFTLIELKESMRQRESLVFVDILNALRIGELKGNHISVLLQKVSKDFSGEFGTEKALRIYPTNEQVTDHNKSVLSHFKAKGLRVYKVKAFDQLVEGSNNQNVDMERIVPKDINKTAGLPEELEIFVGAKVMLRSNIDVLKGLVNEAIGTITNIKWPYFRRDQILEGEIPDSVCIDFGRDGIHEIKPKSIQFPANFSKGTVERRMLPIILSWASTVHKMQGCTVDNAVVYLGLKLFAPGQAYVALSRVRSLEGLLIDELDCRKLTGKKPCNTDALSEMERMRNQRNNTDE